MQTFQCDVVIIGAGPAGLATAACLRKLGIHVIILEKSDRVAHSWANHYHRLHLHTAGEYSMLPHLPFPRDYPQYPSRLQVVAYLEEYARTFDLLPRYGEEVLSVQRTGGVWLTCTKSSQYRSLRVVVATSYNSIPVMPAVPGCEKFLGTILHSSKYTSGAMYGGKHVLVVGCGNTGAEIAMDLVEQGAASSSLVIRSPIHIVPRDAFGMPTMRTTIKFRNILPLPVLDFCAGLISRLVIGDVSSLGIRKPTEGVVTLIEKKGRVSLIDVGTVKLMREGKILVVASAVHSFADDGRHVQFADGTQRAFDVVVFATGYKPSFQNWLHSAAEIVNDRGYPQTHGRNVGGKFEGLYFIGFRNPSTGALREISIEAQRIATDIAKAKA